jgi:hypothetical protein
VRTKKEERGEGKGEGSKSNLSKTLSVESAVAAAAAAASAAAHRRRPPLPPRPPPRLTAADRRCRRGLLRGSPTAAAAAASAAARHRRPPLPPMPELEDPRPTGGFAPFVIACSVEGGAARLTRGATVPLSTAQRARTPSCTPSSPPLWEKSRGTVVLHHARLKRRARGVAT